MKRLLILLAFLAAAQSVNRNVLLNWGASTTVGVTGYNVYRAPQAATPVYVVVNTSPITGTAYTDATAVIGNTYLYTVTALTPACTLTTPVTQACGESEMSSPVTVPVPIRPTSTTGAIVVIVQ